MCQVTSMPSCTEQERVFSVLQGCHNQSPLEQYLAQNKSKQQRRSSGTKQRRHSHNTTYLSSYAADMQKDFPSKPSSSLYSCHSVASTSSDYMANAAFPGTMSNNEFFTSCSSFQSPTIPSFPRNEWNRQRQMIDNFMLQQVNKKKTEENDGDHITEEDVTLINEAAALFSTPLQPKISSSDFPLPRLPSSNNSVHEDQSTSSNLSLASFEKLWDECRHHTDEHVRKEHFSRLIHSQRC